MPFNTCYRGWARLVFILGCLSVVHSSVTPFLPQSFFFDWNKPTQPVPILITEQCEAIHITWSRSTAVGPNPVAPYYLQVYTSTSIIPLVIPAGNGLSFDWPVPFAPGTQYQICMFDTNGNTGGCQATYTVIPSSVTPTCSNVTFPPLLAVDAVVNNGPMSQYGWIDQCTDLSVTPKNGTAPYILTIAPALHPPYNITTSKVETLNWTISLSWAAPFFISLADADGNMWSNGPLHSGGGGSIACLAGNTTFSSSDSVKPYIAISAGVSGLAVGLLCGTLAAYLFTRRRYKKKLRDRFVGTGPGTGLDSSHNTTYDPLLAGSSQYRPVPTTNGQHSNASSVLMNRMGTASPPYQFEPLVMPDEQGRLTYEQRSPTSTHGPGHVGYPQSAAHDTSHSPPGPRQQGQVYVLHHDSNIPPVTIFHEDGTRIVELPPRYARPTTAGSGDGPSETRTGSDSRSEGSRTDGADGLLLHPVRRPGTITKASRQPR